MRATRSRCPTAYCGNASRWRTTSVSAGAASRPIVRASAPRARAISSASGRSTTASSPARPSEHLKIACVALSARCGHFEVAHVHAVMSSCSSRATRKPVPAGARAVSRGYASATSATEAVPMPSSSAAAPGAALRDDVGGRGGRASRARRRRPRSARRSRARRRGRRRLRSMRATGVPRRRSAPSSLGERADEPLEAAAQADEDRGSRGARRRRRHGRAQAADEAAVRRARQRRAAARRRRR